MQFRKITVAVATAALFGAFTTSFAANEKKDAAAVEQAVTGSWRSADAKARDTERHPQESLTFWGLKPG